MTEHNELLIVKKITKLRSTGFVLNENSSVSNRRRNSFWRRPSIQICVLIVLTFFIINGLLFIALQKHSNFTVTTQASSSAVPPHLSLNIPLRSHLDSIYYLYIDIGCFNGETIEHFIHYTPNSSIYNIITFEPDPENYRLCRSALRKRKYAHMNIIILPHIVWIRNEKLSFRTGLRSYSRIETDPIHASHEKLDAIDFSAWLAELTRSKKIKLHLKLSVPGAEVPVLEKLALDDTFALPERYEIEWTDRSNPKFRGRRIYIQLLLDSYGYDCLYYTRLDDARNLFGNQRSWDELPKYYDWRILNESDTFAHYIQRPDHIEAKKNK